MPLRQAGSLRIFQFDSLTTPNLIHAVFTRHGGVSPEPWHTLNVGGAIGDLRERVVENRRRSFEAIERDPDSIYDVWQVHSAETVLADSPRNGRQLVQADILISANPRVTLFMRFADCVPILLYDPKKKAVGMVHAGRVGTLRGAATSAVRAMVETFGTRPEDLTAGIGPSIGPDHYAIGPEVVAQVRSAFGKEADRHLRVVDGVDTFDLWSANLAQLEEQGVCQIEIAGLCTFCNREDWYSHRAENGKTGRFGALIALSG